jgi:hypothetical protein
LLQSGYRRAGNTEGRLESVPLLQTVLLFIINAEMDLLFTTLVIVVLLIAIICRGMTTFIMTIGRVLHLQIMTEVSNTKGMGTAITRHLTRPLEEDTDAISHSDDVDHIFDSDGSGLCTKR